MKNLKAFKTDDKSKKITTYLFESNNKHFAFDLGTNKISEKDLKSLDYLIISHEHSDHCVGLFDPHVADILLNGKCKIYATNTTKDLLKAIFQNVYRTNFDNQDKSSYRVVESLLDSIKGLLFFEKEQLDKDVYIKLLPSGHTYGSSMVYLSSCGDNVLYTGDFDYNNDDSDRRYDLVLDEDEMNVDYVICDATCIDILNDEEEDLAELRDLILKKHRNNFLYKAEKIPFLAKKIIDMNGIRGAYRVVYKKDLLWYIKILLENGFNPFVPNKIIMDCSDGLIDMEIDKEHPVIYLTSKQENKQTICPTSLGLHIHGNDFINFVSKFSQTKTKLIYGHYDNYHQLKDFLKKHPVLKKYNYEIVGGDEDE